MPSLGKNRPWGRDHLAFPYKHDEILSDGRTGKEEKIRAHSVLTLEKRTFSFLDHPFSFPWRGGQWLLASPGSDYKLPANEVQPDPRSPFWAAVMTSSLTVPGGGRGGSCSVTSSNRTEGLTGFLNLWVWLGNPSGQKPLSSGGVRPGGHTITAAHTALMLSRIVSKRKSLCRWKPQALFKNIWDLWYLKSPTPKNQNRTATICIS